MSTRAASTAAAAPAPPEGDWVRGLSIKQPWTSLIAAGVKPVENRPRFWAWRGWVLLHAGLQPDRYALRVPQIARAVRGLDLPTGAVIGVARLVGCHQDPAGSSPCSVWAEPGQWHLELADAQELALPIPARGRLGPWKPDEELIVQVCQQLPGLRRGGNGPGRGVR